MDKGDSATRLPSELMGVSNGQTMEAFINNPPQEPVAFLADGLPTVTVADSHLDMYTDGSHAHGRDNLMVLCTSLHPPSCPSATPHPLDLSGIAWLKEALGNASDHQRTLV